MPNIVKTSDHVMIITSREGRPGKGGAGGAGVFITDVVGLHGGAVGAKVYKEGNTPEQAVLHTASSDTRDLRVYIRANGGMTRYTPELTVNGMLVTHITELPTLRYFEGYIDIELPEDGMIVARHQEAGRDEVFIGYRGPGPNVLSVEFGPYPGVQTELKSGDVISVTVTTEEDAVAVSMLAQGALDSQHTLQKVGTGVFQGTLVIGGGSGQLPVYAVATDDIQSAGEVFMSDPLTLNQTHPTIGQFAIQYPEGQQALKDSEQALVSATVSDADEVFYTSPNGQLDVVDAEVYEEVKVVTRVSGDYNVSAHNHRVLARRVANDAVTISSTVVRIAHVPATAAINITGNPARLKSSPTGELYSVNVTPSQMLMQAPSLEKTGGQWEGDWFSNYSRHLRIYDTTPKGPHTFYGLNVKNLAGIEGSEITSGSSYSVGGFDWRQLTVAAFSQVVEIGTSIGQVGQVQVRYSGTTELLTYRADDLSYYPQGFTIVNEQGEFDAQGNVLFLTDSEFTGANTSGTLKVDIREVP